MLIQTVKRLYFQKPEDIYIATNSEYRDLVMEQTKDLVPPENIIIEPALRDTAPCIGLIASILGKQNPDDVMAVIYADHLIQDLQELEICRKTRFSNCQTIPQISKFSLEYRLICVESINYFTKISGVSTRDICLVRKDISNLWSP